MVCYHGATPSWQCLLAAVSACTAATRTEKCQYVHQNNDKKVTQNQQLEVVKEYTKISNHKEIEVDKSLRKELNTCDLLETDKDSIKDSEEDATRALQGCTP